jgi:hypothetical protein
MKLNRAIELAAKERKKRKDGKGTLVSALGESHSWNERHTILRSSELFLLRFLRFFAAHSNATPY